MKRILVLVAALVLVGAANGFAQSTIATGPHDFSAGSALRNAGTSAVGTQTCVFCHTPHGGSTAIPLWNRGNPTGAYQVYTSATMDAATPLAATIQSSISGACLSCHDGSIGIDVLSNVGGAAFAGGIVFTVETGAKATYTTTGGVTKMATGVPYMGTDLRNDHPVTIIYETARAATSSEFKTVAAGAGGKYLVTGLPLYGTDASTATVECASCHNPHNNQYDNFLRKSNAASALCLSCHTK